jgi:hypothetical protein
MGVCEKNQAIYLHNWIKLKNNKIEHRWCNWTYCILKVAQGVLNSVESAGGWI